MNEQSIWLVILLLFAAGLVMTPEHARAQSEECWVCFPCPEQQDYKTRDPDGPSTTYVDPPNPPEVGECDTNVTFCSQFGTCDPGLLAVRTSVTETMQALRRDDPTAVVRLAALHPQSVVLIEERGLLVVTTRCSRQLPVGAVPVGHSEITAVKRILAEYNSTALAMK